MPGIDRRALLRALTAFCVGGGVGAWPGAARARASVLEKRPFLEPTRVEPGTSFGSGLGGRLALDLRRLPADGLVVTNRDFFVRTKVPSGVERRRDELDEWRVRFSTGDDASGHLLDFGGADMELSISELRAEERPMGLHLLECSGNSARHRFGLVSVAEWSGVPLRELFSSTLGNTSPDTRVLVTGNDEHSEESRGSTMGASWIFTVDEIERAGAFLATRMNGEPLPLDHGAPVRLIVPGWYGCSCIKWVESVVVVRDDHPATSQMREFARRTHQNGQPELARDYIPATIDFTAMPVLVEGRDDEGAYVTTGIAWGDPSGVGDLSIRYRHDEEEPSASDWLPIRGFEPQPASSWTLWRHSYQPRREGEHEITLRAEGSSRTRRLDSGYYARRVLFQS